MKTVHFNKISRFYFGSFILLMTIVIAGMGVFRTLASDEANENLTKNELVSVQLKSQNTTAINFRPGRDLPTLYDSNDNSSDNLKAGENRPRALFSADFDMDGFPDLVTGYAAPDGGVLTFHKANPEAFAPQSEESFAGISEGRFPDPFLKNAESFHLPAAPDFLVAGDFDRNGNPDVVTATRGGDKIYLLSGTGRDSGFNTTQEINLAGHVTALTAGEINISDNRADLVVGIEGDSGASLLVFEDAENGVFGAAANYELSSPAISLELGKLDDDLFADTAILTGDGVSVLHGRTGNKSAKSGAARMEKINLPFAPQAMTTGEFIFDRAGKTELALLAEDGSVRIARRGELDERPFSIEEARANRRQVAEKRLRGVEDILKTWQRGTSEDWTIADGVNIAALANRQNAAAPILMKANLSGQNIDDVLFLDSTAREIKILSAPEAEKTNGEFSSFGGQRSVYSLETVNQPTAMLSMKLNNFVRPGLVILQDGKTEPSFVPSAPTANFTVTKTTDGNDGACSADCSLREAITAANASAGADTITLPAGIYTLTLTNAGGTNEDNNATGDLDIRQDLTINGVGQATTIVQAGTTNANGIDKVFASNPICTSVVSTSMSGLTVRFGRNTQPNGAADFSFTGGGMDWCNTGSGGTLTVTNSTFDNNNATTGSGGGINLDTSFNTSGSVSLTGVTISNNSASNQTANSIIGGGLATRSGPYNVTITNSTISGNNSKIGDGGGIYFAHNANVSSTFLLSGVTISNNSAFSQGGGIFFNGSGNHNFTLNQGSVVSGNTSGTGASGTAAGGGLNLQALGTSTATVTKSTITGNVLSPNTADNRGGAGIFAGSGPITISFNRIVGNTGTPAASGTGLRKDTNSGATNAVNNWWGCNTGPSAAPCDTAVISAGSAGSLTFNPWLRYTHTASPSSIVVGQTSTLTASFLTNSAGTAIAASNLDALVGVPISFNTPVRGTISAAQATIQASGTATATFTGTSVGAGSANAVVDNGTATANITITQATTTTTITSDNPDPSVVGQTITVAYTVAPQFSGTPTGNVTVSDGVNGCTGTVAAGQCTVALTTLGARTLTATYSGDTNFTGSSDTEAHQVNKADTTTTITNDTPDPSVVGQAYAVTASVAVNSPGAGTPTGTITVSDGSQTCTITLPATNCNLTSTAAGNKTLTATYNGNANFNQSPASAGAAHTVNKAATTTTINSNTPNPSGVNTAVTVTYLIAVTSPGAGTPTGTVTVSDGVSSCMGTVAAGSCNITLTTSGVRTLTATYNSDTDFNGSVSNGVSQTVTSPPATVSVSGTISYGTAPAGQPKFVSGVLMSATGVSSVSINSDNSGVYLLDNLTAGGNYTVTPSKTGNGNGITAFDATLVLRCVAAGNGCTLTANQKKAADTDGDTNVTAFDAAQILRFVAANGQNQNTGQTGNWKFIDPMKTYNPLSASQTNQNYTAFLIGEVDGDWTP